nr:MAG TPA: THERMOSTABLE DNA LIGASE [Caudoviricetes sp.]
MDEVIKIFKELQESSGKRLQEILEEHKDNELLKKVLWFVYNPYIVTGLSSKKINKIVNKQIKYAPAETVEEVFEYLQEHNTGTDIDIAYVLEFIQNKPNQEMYSQIFTKELKLGITSKTINKVFPNLIPEFNVMLAEKYWDRMEELEKTNPDIIITQKYDGVRCVAIHDKSGIKLFSRQGKPIEGLYDLEEQLLWLPFGCFDGELLLNKDNIPSKDLYRETVTVVNSKDQDKKNIVFNIFDTCEIKEFENGYCSVPCIERKKIIQELEEQMKPDWWKSVPILYYGKYDKDIVQQELNKQIALEHEGVMVNIANAPYEARRTKNILKVKAMQDCDLKIIGFEEGTGKNKGTLGAIIVDYKGFEVRVGSGFTDQDREYFWANQNELLGRVITVQYFEETTNKKDNSLSLRFPVYLELREKGKEVSYF